MQHFHPGQGKNKHERVFGGSQVVAFSSARTPEDERQAKESGRVASGTCELFPAANPTHSTSHPVVLLLFTCCLFLMTLHPDDASHDQTSRRNSAAMSLIELQQEDDHSRPAPPHTQTAVIVISSRYASGFTS